MRSPLRYQIMLPMAATMLLTVVAVGGIGALLGVRATKVRIGTQIAEVAKILEESNFPLTDAVLRQMRALSGAELVVVGVGGKIVATSGLMPKAASLPLGPMATANSFPLGAHTALQDEGYFHTAIDLAEIGRANSPATFHILYPEVEYRRAWQRAVYPSIGFVLLAMPVIALLTAVTSKRIGARVARLQSHVERIAQGDFEPMTISERDDEIRALGESVNRMAAMLTQYEQDVRATERMRTLALLGGGIAHQLRNSSTGCAMALDLHTDECPLGDTCESLEIAKRQLRLMEEYVQRFLQLGKRPDDSCNNLVDLRALVNDLLPLVQPAARHAGIELRRSPISAPIPMIGNPQSLNQLVINLLLNAIEAASREKTRTNSPGRVDVSLERALPNRAILSISDTGQGPSNDMRDQLFEPFATDRIDGVGIGLAMAREIAEQHCGTINWRRADGITTFLVELPCEAETLERNLVYAASR